jgi:hypothetical protein
LGKLEEIITINLGYCVLTGRRRDVKIIFFFFQLLGDASSAAALMPSQNLPRSKTANRGRLRVRHG